MDFSWIIQEVDQDSEDENELHVFSAQQGILTQANFVDRGRTPNGAWPKQQNSIISINVWN